MYRLRLSPEPSAVTVSKYKHYFQEQEEIFNISENYYIIEVSH